MSVSLLSSGGRGTHDECLPRGVGFGADGGERRRRGRGGKVAQGARQTQDARRRRGEHFGRSRGVAWDGGDGDDSLAFNGSPSAAVDGTVASDQCSALLTRVKRFQVTLQV